MAFVFYDTETTGLNSAFCQIVQFAAILTDDDLNEIERVNLRCRLRPHILPSPQAMLITGVGPDELVRPDFPSNYEMAIQLRDLFNRWGSAVFIGHNTIKFDEGFLRQLFYQSLLPVYATNTGGSSRADTLNMARAFAGLHPEEFKVPLNEKGKSVFKLEALASENGFGDFQAHDALADVEATLFIAKLMRTIDPTLFEHLVAMGRKAAAEALSLSTAPVFLPVSENGNIELAPLAGIISDPSQHARTIAVDLRHDPSEVMALDLGEFDDPRSIRIRGRMVFRRLAVNNQPTILTAEICGLGSEEIVELSYRAEQLRTSVGWIARLGSAFEETAASYDETEHVEERMYDGFPSHADQRLMDEFHSRPWSNRAELVSQFGDPRFRQIGLRLLAEHFPEGLSSDARERHQAWLKERLMTGEERPWLTRSAAIAELNELEATGEVAADYIVQIRRYFLTAA